MRRSTRWPGSSGSDTRADRPSTGSPTRAIPTAFAFPRSLPGDGYDFSFSGLKTSVVNTVRKHPEAATVDVAASFRQAVVDVLVARSRRAAADIGATALCLAGGVAANSLLRARIEEACAEDGIGAFLPSRALCTDNAAMVAAAGWWRLQHGGTQPTDPGRRPQPPVGDHQGLSGGPTALSAGPAAARRIAGTRRPPVAKRRGYRYR